MSELGDYADVQGTLLRGYRVNCARHFILRVVDPAAARAFLGALASGSFGLPQITTAEDWGPGGKPEFFLNVAVTFSGLRHLGVERRFLESFPEPFRRGATDEDTKLRVGDTGHSDSSEWTNRLGEGDAVDLILSLWVWRHQAEMDRVSGILRRAFTGALEELSALDAAALPKNKVHFGYTDNISQPLLEGAPERKHRTVDPEKVERLPITHVLLHDKSVVPEELSTNSGFAAFRVLEQDVEGFEQFLDECAAEAGIDKELLAAKVCGRWRTGVPLSRSPDTPDPTPPLTEEELNDFDYLPDDPLGHTCPIGSHIRRANPRSQAVQGGPGIVKAARIVRRAMPYDVPADAEHPDHRSRGLVGYFINSDLLMFEFVMQEWVNGSQFVMSEPIDGSNPRYNISGKDLLIGANDPESSSFTLHVASPPGAAPTSRELTGFHRFVTTRGGAYVYFPSVTALRHLASLQA